MEKLKNILLGCLMVFSLSLQAQNTKLDFVGADLEDCGLNFVYGVTPVSSRYPIGRGLPASVAINNLPANVEIVKAFAYLFQSFQTNDPTIISLRVTNPLSIFKEYKNLSPLESNAVNCNSQTGYNLYKIDITNSIRGNGNYRISYDTPINPTTVEGCAIIIVYKDKNATYTGHLRWDEGIITSSSNGQISHAVQNVNACATSSKYRGFALLSDLELTKSLTHTSSINNDRVTLVPNTYFQMDIDSTGGIVQQQQTVNYFFESDAIGILPRDCFSLLLAGIYYQTSCENCTCEIRANMELPTICENEPVKIIDQSQVIKGNQISTYYIDYGNGVKDTVNNLNSISYAYPADGSYSVTLIVENSDIPPCRDLITKNITIHSNPQPIIQVDKNTAVWTNPLSNEQIFWDSSASSGPDTLSRLSLGIHYFEVRNSNCSIIDSFVVTDTLETACNFCCTNSIKFPNAFNPASSNNTFKSFLNKEKLCIDKISMTLYNRWGNALYTGSNEELEEWRGTNNQNLSLSPGIYIIQLSITTFTGEQKTIAQTLVIN